MKVSVDRDVCIAAGQCAITSPEVFGQRDEDGLVELLLREPPAELAAGVRLAVSLCPSRAITVRE
ncbi:ferredoxin [Actinomadura sp. GC306]|uniref:ferredoxin n=1 Tax=Actinomadura sp. GC306 TaxID=2530367 RepID=UPI00104B56C1|nr:ferredoxin [Actinomadura sp. GC306]TDC67748.1 ferredoxin [Actinomadura sp. GC306]